MVIFSSVPVRLEVASPNHALMLGADDHGSIAIWDINIGKQVQEIQIPHNGPVVALRWLSVEQGIDIFSVGCGDGSILVYARPGVDVSTTRGLAVEVSSFCH
jgi:WD40 repeat protein